MTTLAKHSTTAETWTPPAWVTKARYRVAGEQGFPRGTGYGDGGLGAIISAILPVSGTVTLGVGSRAGGAGAGGGQAGGRASTVADMVAGAGGGSGWEVIRTDPGTYRGNGGFGGVPGLAGGDGASGRGAGQGGGGKADGAGGAAGSASGGTATAGQSNAAGGAGGAGKAYSSGGGGGGGGGFGGGGGGSVDYDGSGPASLGAQGGGGSSTFGSGSDGVFEGYNEGAPWIDVLIAAAPLQPTPLSPTDNVYIDRTTDQPFTFKSNPASADALDAQTDAIFEYRVVGAPSWTAVSNLGTATVATIPAGTLAVGSYEGRYRTKADGGVGDALGVWGPNSETFYFRADDPAVAPTITSPTSGAVVAVNSATATWTVASQTAYQMRVVGDNAGAPDPGTIYADSGEVISTDRTKTLTVGVNHVPAHVQVRVRDKTGGVWSAWASVAVTIEWAGPPKPRVTLATDWRIHVTVTNPAPVGVEPVADRIEVYVHENGVRERRAILAPGDGWIYETPPSGVEIGVEAVAIYTPTNVQTSSGVIY